MRGTSKLYIIFRFHILGFFYFLKTEVALSLWVFNLLANVLRGTFAILGVGNTPSLGSGHGIPHTLQVYHAMGAMVVLFLGGLWAARRHLAEVWRKAWSGDPAIDDGDEILSYRATVIILAVGTAIMPRLAVAGWIAAVGWGGVALFGRCPFCRLYSGGRRGWFVGRCAARGAGRHPHLCGRLVGFGSTGLGLAGQHLYLDGQCPQLCHGLLCQ